MFPDTGDIRPSWPVGYDGWATAMVLFLTGFTKVYRAKIMHDHALRIDAFGWSVILFDVVFGSGLLIGLAWSLYPGIHTLWFDRAVILSIMLVAGWQFVMVFRADHERIDRAMSAREPHDEGGEPIPYERRERIRRLEDRLLRARIAELENQ